MNIPDALQKGALSLACASAVWFGSTVVGASRDNTRQDEKLTQLETRQQALDTTLKALDESVRKLDTGVAVLNERLRKK